MKIELSYEPLAKLQTGLLVVILDEKKDFFHEQHELVTSRVNGVRQSFKQKTIKREAFITMPEDSSIRNLVIFWTGFNHSHTLEECIKNYTAKALDIAKNYGIHDVTILMNTEDGVPFISAIAEGILLGSYTFDRYKKDKDTFYKDCTVRINSRIINKRTNEKRLDRNHLVSQCINECRNLVNEPGSVVYPEIIADIATDIGKQYKYTVKVWKKAQLEKEGFNGLLQVGKGSIHTPCFIMIQNNRKSRYHVGYIGKGITFDSGGISLKPSMKMYEMKGDMAGAAAVLYTMKAIAELDVPVKVTAFIPTAENMPDATAQRPGDIFYARNGKSIMVDNTDAEGRLILTDALFEAGRQECTHIIDIATLTGACVRALGTSIAGILGNNQRLIQAVIEAGRRHGEGYWELPMIEEYKEMLKTPVADINNVGGEYAGAITAALFLREFVPENTPWAHLDIAGPFIQSKQWKYYEAGATAFGLKTLVALAEDFNSLIVHKYH